MSKSSVEELIEWRKLFDEYLSTLRTDRDSYDEKFHSERGHADVAIVNFLEWLECRDDVQITGEEFWHQTGCPKRYRVGACTCGRDSLSDQPTGDV